MHAIINADYKFDQEYWEGISDTGKFLKKIMLFSVNPELY
jgi:hypothetical protein